MPAPSDRIVPLPHGTDVVTLVPRQVDGTEIATGTIGRIVGSQGDTLDLQLLGLGVVRYQRSEVAPYRSGQIRYALARDEAWQALRPNVVLEAVVGSRALGLADADSDGARGQQARGPDQRRRLRDVLGGREGKLEVLMSLLGADELAHFVQPRCELGHKNSWKYALFAARTAPSVRTVQ